jgi:hypothetical protein
MSPPLVSGLVALVQQRQALRARDGGAVLRGDSFHFGPMSGFLITRITEYHAVLVEGVQVTFPSAVARHWPHSHREHVLSLSDAPLVEKARVVSFRDR